MFCDLELAARIERAEQGLVREVARAVALRDPDGVLALDLAGGVAVCAGPTSPLTKVAGLGFDGAPADAELARVEAAFAERGAPVAVELSTLADAAVAERLGARGYVLRGFEQVLGRAPDAPGPAPRADAESVEVVDSDPDDLERWLCVLLDGFAEPDARGRAPKPPFDRPLLETLLRDMAHATGFRRLVARRGGEAVGAASLRIADDVAQLCGAATLPAHRRRGVQAALLERRLELAREAGCAVAVMTTAPASTSQQNAQRRGFALLYARGVWVREGPARA